MAARTSSGRADHHDPLPGPGDRGVEELAGQQPRLRWRQDHHDLVGLRALALVDGQRVHGLDLAEAAGGEVEPAGAAGDGGTQARARVRPRAGGRRRRCRRCRPRGRSRWRSPGAAGRRTTPRRSARPSPRPASARPGCSSGVRRRAPRGARTAAAAGRAARARGRRRPPRPPAAPRGRAGRPAPAPATRVVDVDQLDVLAAGLEQRDAPDPRRRPGPPRPARRSTRRSGARSPARPRRPGSSPARSSTRSASTAPASTEASWNGSPTRISRLPGRTASSSRAIIVSDTMEVSSTTTTSCGSRLSRWCRNRDEVSGRAPSSRCRVTARTPASRSRSVVGEPGDLVLHRLLEPGRGLAGRRGERDAHGGFAGQLGLLGAEREQRGDRGRLAGAGTAGQHGGGVGERDPRGRPLLVVAPRPGRPGRAPRPARPRPVAAVPAGRPTRSAWTCSSSRQ